MYVIKKEVCQNKTFHTDYKFILRHNLKLPVGLFDSS